MDFLPDGWHGFASESGVFNDEKTTLESHTGLQGESCACVDQALEVTPDNDDYKDTLQQIEAAIEELKG